MTRILVCGGRDYGVTPLGCHPKDRARYDQVARDQRRLIYDTLDMIKIDRGISAVIHGAATGADTVAGYWAARQLIAEEPYPAAWKRDGKAAGPIRNARMLDEGKPNLVVAFPGGKGTADMVSRARKAGIEIIEVT